MLHDFPLSLKVKGSYQPDPTEVSVVFLDNRGLVLDVEPDVFVNVLEPECSGLGGGVEIDAINPTQTRVIRFEGVEPKQDHVQRLPESSSARLDSIKPMDLLARFQRCFGPLWECFGPWHDGVQSFLWIVDAKIGANIFFAQFA